ncbi:beta-lactamase family protein [Chitinophaga dinghuensis]|uniref:Beta-lactamase family protein n=1 Tax=Chitinophaga dinghuensis TaxID=1539050 RepID=A0A327W2Q6_9BACT|nr:MBL fold metallo-hydrolase [Chitinophaga dinghuensis]RAJ83529.1 beta-lactamase family protein [Chitinophaga dinghuensis]
MQLLFLRNATFLLEWNNKKILVDPMLGTKGSMDPVPNTANAIRNPTVDLTLSDIAVQTMVQDIDAVLLTHTHRDHWDVTAQEMLPKTTTIICQPEDVQKITDAGFINVIPVNDSITWNQFTIHRTGGQHGTGEIGKLMAPVSGFVITDGDQRLYIAGDTIWCNEVKETLDRFKPEHTVVNAGAARFLQGDPITMTAEDVLQVINHPANTNVIAVHMESINHCTLTREDLAVAVAVASKECNIPDPGDWIMLN